MKDKVLITNFGQHELKVVSVACEATKIPYEIHDTAYDLYGNIIPGFYALYIPKEAEEAGAEDAFWDAYRAVLRLQRVRHTEEET